MADKTEVVVETPVVVPPEVVVEKTDLELALERAEKAEKDRDNYKEVALKRLGKLPGDAEFIDKDGKGLSVQEQVRLELLEREVETARIEEKAAQAKVIKENQELKLALKNRPGAGLGGGSGDSPEVKDNVFSNDQLKALEAKAIRLKVDPKEFIERAKKNLANNQR